MRITTFLLFSFCLTQSIKAQVNPQQERLIKESLPAIDSLFSRFAVDHHIPGIAYGLVVNGKLFHSGAYGYADLEKHIAADSTIDFRVASMSKSFTAMAVLRLRDEGRIKLDDPAWKYVPQLKNWKSLTKDAEPVTIRQLLSHNAGFPEDNPWGDRQLALPDKDFLDFLSKGVSFSHAPGTAYEYSNLAFAILGQVIRNVSGQPYEKYITDSILRPLGMTHSYWEYSEVPDTKLARGYRWLEDKWVPQPMLHDGAYGAMGGLISTVSDFTKYLAYHLQAWPPNDAPETGPLKRSSLREMQKPWTFNSFDPYFRYADGRLSPTVSQYCYGLRWVCDADNRVYIGHTGGLPGFGSHWYIMPDYGIGIVAFGNSTYASMSKIDLEVLDTLINIAQLKPFVAKPSAILLKRQKELAAFFPDWKAAEKSSIFAENFFLDNLIAPLRKETQQAFAAIGPIQEIKEIVPENALRGTFDIIGAQGKLSVYFTLSPEADPKIQAFRIFR